MPFRRPDHNFLPGAPLSNKTRLKSSKRKIKVLGTTLYLSVLVICCEPDIGYNSKKAREDKIFTGDCFIIMLKT